MLPASGPMENALARARRQLLERGAVPVGLLSDLTLRSWQRSLSAGLAPRGRVEPRGPASAALREIVEREQQFIAFARPVMDYVFGQVRGSGSIVILACGNGMVVNSLGDPTFLDKAARVALQPGHSWHEAERGTNAIGTALAEGVPVTVHGEEHFLEHNGFLTCTAAPVHDPAGTVIGVIDVSGECASRSPHTEATVRMAAHMIENQLFHARHRGAFRLNLHASPEGIGTLAEIGLALDEGGRIIGVNHAARALLGPDRLSRGPVALERVLGLRLSDLIERASGGGELISLVLPGGRRLHAELHRPAAPPRRRAALVAEGDALAALDTGDAALREVLSRARRLAAKPVPLLLRGESGTGKDVLARAIHASGPRRSGPFVAMNCAALPESLIEAELFGYRAGAFTGAAREGNPGRLREAHGGTLFLDEIGDMPLALQARLLRVLENREVVPLGGGRAVALAFALISATPRALAAEVAAGHFRADLYYRLSGVSLRLPALRARQDLPALIERLLARIAPDRAIGIEPDLLAALATYPWPGNIRELAHVLSGAVALMEPFEHRIGFVHLCPDLAAQLRGGTDQVRAPATTSGQTLRGLAHDAVRHAFDAAGGNVSEAARRLAISRKTLYRKLREAERRA